MVRRRGAAVASVRGGTLLLRGRASVPSMMRRRATVGLLLVRRRTAVAAVLRRAAIATAAVLARRRTATVAASAVATTAISLRRSVSVSSASSILVRRRSVSASHACPDLSGVDDSPSALSGPHNHLDLRLCNVDLIRSTTDDDVAHLHALIRSKLDARAAHLLEALDNLAATTDDRAGRDGRNRKHQRRHTAATAAVAAGATTGRTVHAGNAGTAVLQTSKNRRKKVSLMPSRSSNVVRMYVRCVLCVLC